MVSFPWVLSPTPSTRRYQLVKPILVFWRKNGNRIPVSWTLRSFLSILVLWRTYLSPPCNHLSWDLIRFLEPAPVGRCNSFSGLIQDQPLPGNCPVSRNLQVKLKNRVEPWIQWVFYLLRIPGKILNFNPVKQFLSWIKIWNPSILQGTRSNMAPEKLLSRKKISTKTRFNTVKFVQKICKVKDFINVLNC